PAKVATSDCRHSSAAAMPRTTATRTAARGTETRLTPRLASFLERARPVILAPTPVARNRAEGSERIHASDLQRPPRWKAPCRSRNPEEAGMAAITESVEIARRPEDVFAYLDQLGRHGEWQEQIV